MTYTPDPNPTFLPHSGDLDLEYHVRLRDNTALTGRGLVPYSLAATSLSTLSRTSDCGYHNSGVINAALSRLGTPGFCDAIRTAGKAFAVAPGITWPSRLGGKWRIGGGATYSLEFDQLANLLGSVTLLVNTTASLDPILIYRASNFHIDGTLVGYGFPVVSGDDWSSAMAGTFGVGGAHSFPAPRPSAFMVMEDALEGFAAGRLTGGIHGFGFEKIVYASSHYQGNHCDSNTFTWLGGQACDDIWYSDNQQSIGNLCLHMWGEGYIKRMINCQKGGMHVVQLEMNTPADMVCMGTNGPNEGLVQVDNFRIDNSAINADQPFHLLNQSGAVDVDQTVLMNGLITNGSYDWDIFVRQNAKCKAYGLIKGLNSPSSVTFATDYAALHNALMALAI